MLRRRWSQTGVVVPSGGGMGGSSVALCQADATRVYLGVFLTGHTTSYALSLNPGVAIQDAITPSQFPNNPLVLELFWDRHKELTQQVWYGYVQTPGSVINFQVVELFEYNVADSVVNVVGDLDRPGAGLLATDVYQADPGHEALSNLLRTRDKLLAGCKCGPP